MATATRARGRKPADETVEAEVTVPLPRFDVSGNSVEFDDVPLSQMPDVVGLRSPYSEHHVPLIPKRTYDHPVTGRQVVEHEGLTLKFHRGRTDIRREDLPLLADHPAFSGKGRKASIFLEDDPRVSTFADDRGPRVVSGAQSANGPSDQVNAPVRGWDQLSPAEIQQAAEQGRIKDPMGALAFEFRPGGRRREGVKNILWRLSQGEDTDIPVDAIDADASEVTPADVRKV